MPSEVQTIVHFRAGCHGGRVLSLGGRRGLRSFAVTCTAGPGGAYDRFGVLHAAANSARRSLRRLGHVRNVRSVLTQSQKAAAASPVPAVAGHDMLAQTAVLTVRRLGNVRDLRRLDQALAMAEVGERLVERPVPVVVPRSFDASRNPRSACMCNMRML